MEFSLEEKQNYLREEILEQGYNEEEFAKFFEEENKPTEELNEIPLSELQSLVAKFKSNHSPKRSQINQTQFQKSQINQSQLQRSPINQTQFTQNDSNNNEMNISTIISSTIYDINPKPHQNTLCKLHNKTKIHKNKSKSKKWKEKLLDMNLLKKRISLKRRKNN